MVLSLRNVFWFSKDDSTRHSKRQKKKRKAEEEVGWEDNIQEWTGMVFASTTRAAENKTRWKGIVAKSSVVPGKPSKVVG